MKTINITFPNEIPKNYTGIVNINNGNLIVHYQNGKIHREGLPAFIATIVEQEGYFNNGLRHRIGGPALLSGSNGAIYYVYGQQVTKEAHDLLYNLMTLKGMIK